MIKIDFAFKTMKLFFTFTLLLIPAHCFAEVGKKEFESVEKASKYILKHYPRGQYIYVGLGRSPVPVMAYLQSETNTLVRNVPLTDFRYGTDGHPKLSAKEESRLVQHFDEYLPSNCELEGRKKILLVDFAFGGGSIAAGLAYFSIYIEHHRKQLTSVQGLAITMDNSTKALASAFPTLDIFPLLAQNQADPERFDHFLMMMASRLYKDRAEYEGFDIRNPTRLKARLEYQEFVEEMKAAKLKHELGLLTDDWTNTLFDMGANPEKYSSEIATLKGLNAKLSDTEKTRITNEMISKIVARKRLG